MGEEGGHPWDRDKMPKEIWVAKGHVYSYISVMQSEIGICL